jgi:glutamate N-acetyltransferase / amino-acid N-acetyltransferase
MSVTAAGGFRAAGVAAGLKPSGHLDVALVVNDGPLFAAAGVATTNRIKAAPVLWTTQVLKTGSLRAVVLNSGGANACTGPEGFQDTHRTAEVVGRLLGIGAVEVAVCSTGLIGERLPMDRLLAGVLAAHTGLAVDGGEQAAAAILTTDSHPKQALHTAEGYTIGGMAKGAGMLAPSLATMLAVITTDAVVESAQLDTALRAATSMTFDRLDSDGCMSTNDTVLLLASGASGVTPDPDAFEDAVRSTCLDLSMQLLNDAEGSQHDVAITVIGAANVDEAVEVGRAVARSNLVKCAIFGQDPNWGRVLAAIGTTQAAFDPLDLDVSINGIAVCRNSGVGEPRDLVDLSGRDVDIRIDLKTGSAAATVWTNDLTHEYVHENSAYST